jgi:hypothetical protein
LADATELAAQTASRVTHRKKDDLLISEVLAKLNNKVIHRGFGTVGETLDLSSFTQETGFFAVETKAEFPVFATVVESGE